MHVVLVQGNDNQLTKQVKRNINEASRLVDEQSLIIMVGCTRQTEIKLNKLGVDLNRIFTVDETPDTFACCADVNDLLNFISRNLRYEHLCDKIVNNHARTRTGRIDKFTKMTILGDLDFVKKYESYLNNMLRFELVQQPVD